MSVLTGAVDGWSGPLRRLLEMVVLEVQLELRYGGWLFRRHVAFIEL